jgi:hypothetical protein
MCVWCWTHETVQELPAGTGQPKWCSQSDVPKVMFPKWCSQSDVPTKWCSHKVMFPNCFSQSDVPKVMFPKWCSQSDVPKVTTDWPTKAWPHLLEQGSLDVPKLRVPLRQPQLQGIPAFIAFRAKCWVRVFVPKLRVPLCQPQLQGIPAFIAFRAECW